MTIYCKSRRCLRVYVSDHCEEKATRQTTGCSMNKKDELTTGSSEAFTQVAGEILP